MTRLFLWVMALAALFVLSAADEPEPWVFQSVQTQGKDIHYETPIRFAELGFTRFDPLHKYSAAVCNKPVKIDRLTADLAVVRLLDRFDGADPYPCKLVISDAGQIVYGAGRLSFVRHPVSIYEVSPSFYFGTTPVATRVTIAGANLNLVKKIALERETGTPCTDLVVSAAGDTLSCRLPSFEAGAEVDPQMTLYMFDEQGVDVSFFQVEIVEPEQGAVTAVTPTAFTSGRSADVILTLDKPLATLARLPWTPVLTTAAGEAVSSGVEITGIVWADDAKSVAFKLVCRSCDGTYRVALGESNNLAAALIHNTIDVIFVLDECSFKRGETFPPTVSAAATATKAATFYIPLLSQVSPDIKMSLSVGGVAAATTVTQVWPNANIVEAVPQAVLPVGKATWTWEITNVKKGTTSKCVVSNAFDVVATADGAPFISSVVPHVLFKHDAPETVFITGVALDKVTTAAVKFHGAAADAPCTELFVRSATSVECTIPSAKVTPGVATVTLSDAAGKVVAAVSVFGAVLDATVTPTSAKAETATTVDVALASELPLLAPWKLILKPHNGEPLAFGAAWASAKAAQFTGAVFPSGTSGVFVDLVHNDHVAAVLGFIDIPDGPDPGPEPEVGAVRVVPSTYTLPSPTETARFRLFSDNYAPIASEIGSVHFNGYSATVLMSSPHLIVSVNVKEARDGKDAFDVEIFGTDGKTMLKTLAAVTISEHAGKITPATTNTVAFAAEGEKPQFKFAFRDAPENALVTSSYGNIEAKINYAFLGVTYFDLTFATPCAGCDGKVFTVTFDFSSKLGSDAADDVFVVDMQLVASPKLVDLTPREFDFSRGGCVTYSATVDTLSLKVPLQLFLKDNSGISVENVRIDAADKIFTGCLVCQNCASGTFEVSIGAAYTSDDMGALDFPDYKIVVSSVPSSGGGGLGAGIIALIVIGSGFAVAAICYAVYRVRRQKYAPRAVTSSSQTYMSMA